MTKQELFTQQFAIIYSVAGTNIADMSHEQSLAQPESGGNCANWILGHMVNVHNGLMRVLDEDPVWESEQLKRAGFDPITGPENAIDWDTLKSRFLASRDRCLAAISRLSDEALTRGGIPHPFGGTTTCEELLSLIAFHQTYHSGQLGIARRFAGMEGAIKGPGQKGFQRRDRALAET